MNFYFCTIICRYCAIFKIILCVFIQMYNGFFVDHSKTILKSNLKVFKYFDIMNCQFSWKLFFNKDREQRLRWSKVKIAFILLSYNVIENAWSIKNNETSKSIYCVFIKPFSKYLINSKNPNSSNKCSSTNRTLLTKKSNKTWQWQGNVAGEQTYSVILMKIGRNVSTTWTYLCTLVIHICLKGQPSRNIVHTTFEVMTCMISSTLLITPSSVVCLWTIARIMMGNVNFVI